VVGSRSLRAIALGALLTLGGAQLASIAHAIVAAHVTCVEHGELIEDDGPAVPAAGDEGGKAGLQAGDAGAHRHDHCWLGLSAQPRAMSHQLRRAVPHRAHAEPTAAPAPGQPLAARVAVWRVAPKSSPPASA
jgi:hypothetical protein